MKTVWDFDLLSGMPEMTTEQAKEEWENLRDSREKSDQNKLELLLAQIAFQEILFVSKKYGFDEQYVFSKFNMKWVLKFCSGRDLNRGFFWADLYEAIRDRSKSLYVRKHRKWIRKDVYKRVRRRILTAENRTKEEIINDVMHAERNSIELEDVNALYNDIQKEKEREIAKEKLREAFMNCDLAKRYPENSDYFFCVLTELPERTQKIVIEYLGLTDGNPKGVDEICSQMDLPKEGVARALERYYMKTIYPLKRMEQRSAWIKRIDNETKE